MKQQYRISELAEKAQVSKRTVHYYIARGLLPSPEGAGLGTLYSDDHLFRLQLIRKWQSRFLPLEVIKSRIGSMTLVEVKKSLETRDDPIPMPIPVPSPGKSGGDCYQRICLEEGLELHFCADNPEAKKSAEEILIWFSNQKKEG